jgi:glycosyltransferase involved in cell wall biosynthesis
MTARLVLMLSAAHPPEDVRIVEKEGAALAAAGLWVRHLAPGAAAHAQAHGVEIASHGPAPRGWRGRIRAIPRLARAAAAQAPAVIHAHEPDSWVAALLAARRCGARVVLDVHEHYPSRLDPRLPALLRPPARLGLRLLCRAMAALADGVVVAKEGLDDAFGGPARCTRVRNYATPLALTPRAHGPGPLRLVHLGALTRARGAFTMLEVLARLPDDAQLTLIGRFTDGSEADFHAEAARRGLAARITCFPWMPREPALDLVAGCNVGLVLFRPGVENHRLALPHKLFDCMLAGLPVIVPDFAAEVAAVVAEADCGLAVDTADPAAITAAVMSLADPARRAAMGARGQAAALGRFGWAGEAARLVGLYRGLLAEGRSAAAPAKLWSGAEAPR